jgi:hypothetical protein
MYTCACVYTCASRNGIYVYLISDQTHPLEVRFRIYPARYYDSGKKVNSLLGEIQARIH